MSKEEFTLSHYSAQPVQLNREVRYRQESAIRSYDKPRGFWVSVDGEDDWPTWCKSEGFLEDTLTHRHRVELAPEANVLILPTVEALDEFEAYYSAPAQGWGSGIDWERVATEFDGIIIPTYQWSRRAHDWYYGWDVASGCIWNLEAIQSVDLLVEAHS